MKKILFISSVLITSLLADNSLGTPITSRTIDKVIEKQTITTETIAKQTPSKTYTKTVVPTSNHLKDTHSFKADHHRYDKRFRDFDYDNEAYYNDDGYYYGYYDETGYFYNNIFFTYNNLYTYHDRRYRRGYFIPRHHHHRAYRHHRVNDWNRVHCYREPNHMVYGHYYDHRYYPNRYRDNARMTMPRINHNINQSHSRSSITNHNRRYDYSRYTGREHEYHRNNNRGNYNNSRSYNNRTRMQLHRNSGLTTQYNNTPQQTTSHVQHRSSSGGSAHMQMSR